MLLSDVIVVLSRPSEAGNVGAVCRAMKNSGLWRLRIVKPEFDTWKEGNVLRSRAIHAADIWEKAESFECLSEAVKDCSLVIGTTRRRGRYRKQVSMTPVETATFIAGHTGPAALVFGNERTGLDDGEIALCNMASHIPVDESFPSINLSHAVQIYTYELFQALKSEKKAVKGQWNPLDQQSIETLVGGITTDLERLGFYKQAGREEQERFFRDIFSRASITKKEGDYFASLINRAVRLAEKGKR